MFVDDLPAVPILPSDGHVLELEVGENTITLGGAPVVLDLGNEAGWEWLSNATPEESASLRMAQFERAPPPPPPPPPAETASLRMIGGEDGLTPERIAHLERLALQVPKLGLVINLGSDRDEILPQLLRLFDPETLILDTAIDEEAETLLTQEENLRTLAISGDDVSDLGFLGEIPNLEALHLLEWDPEETGPLPDSLPNLKSIVVIFTVMEALNSLGNQPHLQELTLFGCDEPGDSATMDISVLANHPRLTAVRLRGCPTVVDLSPLDGLRSLRWLGLPWGTTQEQLEEVVRTHPNLTVLELIGSEEITDLTPLTRLGRLEALLVGSTASPEPLYGMDNLEYLAVVVENEDFPSFAADAPIRLQAELPETVIARVEPLEFCLGSGFILLLVPMVLGAWWMTRGRRRGKRPVHHHG